MAPLEPPVVSWSPAGDHRVSPERTTMAQHGWYGRSFPLDPRAVQLRLHIDTPFRRRAAHARLFQVPSADLRGDSPLWQHVDAWAFDPEDVRAIRTVDDAAARMMCALMQLRLPGIG